MGAANLKPNTTQIPNIILDEWTPELTPAEFKVVMIIARQTYGWHKETDRISYSQLQEKTGYKTDAIVAAIKSLRLSGKIIVTDSEGTQLHTKEECQGKTLYYQLNLSDKPRTTSRENRDTKETNTKENNYHLRDNGETPPVIEKKVYGKPDINQILEVWTDITGLDRPSDKNPRFSAKNFLTGGRTADDFEIALKYLINDKGYELTSISGVTRHFSEVKRDVLKQRPLRSLTDKQREFLEAYGGKT